MLLREISRDGEEIGFGILHVLHIPHSQHAQIDFLNELLDVLLPSHPPPQKCTQPPAVLGEQPFDQRLLLKIRRHAALSAPPMKWSTSPALRAPWAAIGYHKIATACPGAPRQPQISKLWEFSVIQGARTALLGQNARAAVVR